MRARSWLYALSATVGLVVLVLLWRSAAPFAQARREPIRGSDLVTASAP